MKTSLSYLPQVKQEQILQVVDIIKEVANPEKIILFGSYATGSWVEDRYFENGTLYEYVSDALSPVVSAFLIIHQAGLIRFFPCHHN